MKVLSVLFLCTTALIAVSYGRPFEDEDQMVDRTDDDEQALSELLRSLDEQVEAQSEQETKKGSWTRNVAERRSQLLTKIRQKLGQKKKKGSLSAADKRNQVLSKIRQKVVGLKEKKGISLRKLGRILRMLRLRGSYYKLRDKE